MASQKWDCVIVGGGIGGAVLACLLAKKKRTALILERELSAAKTSRPELLAGATLDVFHGLGAGERILAEAALPAENLEVKDRAGRVILRFTAKDFCRAGKSIYFTDPGRVREILLEEAAKTGGIQVQRGIEVEHLLHEGGSVSGVSCKTQTGEALFEARFVVGDDGSHSTIRKSLGIPIHLFEFPLKFLAAKDFLPLAESEKAARVCLNPSAARDGLVAGIFVPVPGSRTSFVYVLGSQAYQKFLKEPALFSREIEPSTPPFLFEDMRRRFRFPEDFILLERPFGHAASYSAEGAAILGDAAHPVTPAGGQGANMSVADAVTLAAHWGDFKKYEAIRRPANARSLRFSSRAAAAFALLKIFPLLGPPSLALLSASSSFIQPRVIRNISTAFLSEQEF